MCLVADQASRALGPCLCATGPHVAAVGLLPVGHAQRDLLLMHPACPQISWEAPAEKKMECSQKGKSNQVGARALPTELWDGCGAVPGEHSHCPALP